MIGRAMKEGGVASSGGANIRRWEMASSGLCFCNNMEQHAQYYI